MTAKNKQRVLVTKASSAGIDRKTSVETDLFKTDEEYRAMKYNPDELDELILSNIYAKRCVHKLIGHIVGGGWEIIDSDLERLLPLDLLQKLSRDLEVQGNGYLEISVLSGKVEGLWHIPAQTMRRKPGKTSGFIQKLPDDKTKSFKEFIPASEETESKKASIKEDGNYVIQFIKYWNNPHYGVPVWIAAREKIFMLNNADTYNASFFKNGVPDGLIIAKGVKLSDENMDDIEGVFKPDEGGKKHKFSFCELPYQAEINYLKLNDTIVDVSFLNLQRESKGDICTAFGIPPKLVGIETAGRLGGDNDLKLQIKEYLAGVVKPEQNFLVKGIQKIFPDAKLALKMPVIEVESDQQSPSPEETKPLAMGAVVKSLYEFRKQMIEAE